ncbi:hypothetical protein [Streptomyces atratus]|uniref:hypothetical protein n=1 Tax=Streptomyces atratus TaxID=1893 RepID=UPI0022595300|nr:hypothetical protein [Streptomyces atratus]MCX5345881.1 hypothetical protein [Streptomyces atratus]
MAELFTVKLEVGSRAPVPLVAGLVADLNVVTQGALEVATHAAEAEAEAHMAQLVREGGVTALVQEARRREIPLVAEEEGRDLEFLERDLEEWLYFPPGRRSRSLYWLLLGSSRRYDPLSRLMGQLRAGEVADRLPDVPYRFGSIRYSNPFVVEIIAALGGAAGLGAILGIIRDWGPRRRRQQLENDDLQDANWFKSQMRRAYLRAVEQGQAPPLLPEDLERLSSADLALAVDRLANRELEVQHSSTPEEG